MANIKTIDFSGDDYSTIVEHIKYDKSEDYLEFDLDSQTIRLKNDDLDDNRILVTARNIDNLVNALLYIKDKHT